MTTQEFKNMIYSGMTAAFERDGFVQPLAFFLINGQPVIVEIPMDFMANYESKAIMVAGLKRICGMPGVTAGAFVTEAYAAKFEENDQRKDLVMNGAMRVSECDNKQDIIMMVFSTPVGEEMISHFVNPENKTVGEKMDDVEKFEGLFSGFFKWAQN